jgi:hypothetical protein
VRTVSPDTPAIEAVEMMSREDINPAPGHFERACSVRVFTRPRAQIFTAARRVRRSLRGSFDEKDRQRMSLAFNPNFTRNRPEVPIAEASAETAKRCHEEA